MPDKIHPTAVVHPLARIGADVEIGPYSVIGADVTIGDRTKIGPQVFVDGVTRIGADNLIVGQAALGGPPQDLSYRGEPTELEIGDRNTIREFVTINRGTVKGGGVTRVGNDNMLMACCHVAHDCELRDKIILANGVLLAGHVLVEENANVSGGAAAHHFVTIGAYAYIGGMTRMVQDVQPFMILEGHPSRVRGVNVIGLQRGGVAENDIEDLREAFKRVWRSGDPRSKTLEDLRAQFPQSAAVMRLVRELEQTDVGAKGRYRESLRADFMRIGQERLLSSAETR
ncbi:MAG: acyl-ACP--UDP-N-acetylglucosamine O-acyltransferase [Planctomycetota bacterium]|nr:acyl-ACP--UDP-N-acetylglucosamine O-acyltransferase [Planctomycetota bacterium]